MSKPDNSLRTRLWQLKIRVLPWTRPKPPPPIARPALPPPKVLPEPPDDPLLTPDRIWSELLTRYLPPLTGLSVLDLGCGTGELVHYLAEETAAAELIGVQGIRNYDKNAPAIDHEAFGGRVRVVSGELGRAGLEPRSIDVIICVGFLERLTPEVVSETLEKCFDLLAPGGSLVIRVGLCTAPEPTAMHRRFASPYAQLLVGERDLARLLRARFDQALPYRNWLTASSYVMLVHQAGFEVLDAQRVQPEEELDPELAERLGHVLASDERGELAATLEAHLVRPLTLDDLARTGDFEDTRPMSIRQGSEA
jgi:SAM-dependent methyltransferase